jgi:hypothetical protein
MKAKSDMKQAAGVNDFSVLRLFSIALFFLREFLLSPLSVSTCM